MHKWLTCCQVLWTPATAHVGWARCRREAGGSAEWERARPGGCGRTRRTAGWATGPQRRAACRSSAPRGRKTTEVRGRGRCTRGCCPCKERGCIQCGCPWPAGGCRRRVAALSARSAFGTVCWSPPPLTEAAAASGSPAPGRRPCQKESYSQSGQ